MMTKYFRVDPEVPGELGENTVMDSSVHPPIVTRLHFVFTDWLGDCLIQSFPCFLITEDALQRLRALPLTGYSTDTAQLEEGDTFSELNPGASIPPFRWLKVSGRPGGDDFGLTERGELIISDRALGVLQDVGLTVGEVTPV
jgi:hypothetical protein